MTTQNIFDLVDTWNNGATTFTAIKMNVTDTASGGASSLLDIGTGGGTYVSQFNVRKDGYANAAGGFTVAPASGNVSIALSTAGGVSGIGIASTLGIGWANGIQAFTAPDTILTRRAAANLRFGAADVGATTATVTITIAAPAL